MNDVSLLAPLAYAGIDPVDAALGAAVMFAASVFRGYTGFGFGLVATPLLAILLPPALVVPLVLFLQILATIGPSVRSRADIHWRPIAVFALVVPFGVVPGILALGAIDPDWVRLIIGTVVLIAALQIVRGWRLKNPPNDATIAIAALLNGFLTALASVGGPPMIAVFMASKLPDAAIRATLATAFVFASGFTLIAAAFNGLITTSLAIWAIILLAPMLIGTQIGDRLFHSSFKKHYRRIGSLTLLLIGTVTVARAVFTLAVSPA